MPKDFNVSGLFFKISAVFFTIPINKKRQIEINLPA